MAPVRVLVVDDQRPFRVAASAVLRRTPGFELVGEAASGEEAVEQVAALAPDLVLMDINMPGIGGIEATRRDHRRCPPRRSCSSARRTPRPTCRPTPPTAGAAAYINKDELAADLLTRLWGEARPSADGAPASTA